jgi:hypothetical protein
VDEPDLDRWQSGLFYVDLQAKSDLPVVRRAVREAHRGIVTRCPGLALRPRATSLRVDGTAAVATLACDIDCSYTLTLRRPSGSTVRRFRGRAIGGVAKAIALGRLAAGRYTVTALLVAPVNAGPPRAVTRTFTVG